MSTVTESERSPSLTIKTAWGVESINKAAEVGFFPLIKPVTQCSELMVTVCIYQHKTTGEILADYSNQIGKDSFFFIGEEWDQVLEQEYYPINHKASFAAYLIPQDLKPDTVVWLEELIEDQVGEIHNGVATGRLDSCLAVWTGSDLELLDPVPMISVG